MDSFNREIDQLTDLTWAKIYQCQEPEVEDKYMARRILLCNTLNQVHKNKVHKILPLPADNQPDDCEEPQDTSDLYQQHLDSNTDDQKKNEAETDAAVLTFEQLLQQHEEEACHSWADAVQQEEEKEEGTSFTLDCLVMQQDETEHIQIWADAIEEEDNQPSHIYSDEGNFRQH